MSSDDKDSSDDPPPAPAAHQCQTTNEVTVDLTSAQWKFLFGFCAVFTAITAVGISVWLKGGFGGHWTADPQLFQRMGPEALALFRQHDVNDDGVLDVREFEPLAHILVDVNVTLTYDLPIEAEDQVVTVKAQFEPLDIQTMHLISNNDLVEGDEQLAPLSGLIAWKEPSTEMKNFATKDFALFTTDEPEEKLGTAYHITPYSAQAEEDYYLRFARASCNRFYPPRVAGKLVLLHNLLAMLHPRPFIYTRFAPQGSLACVRGYNDEWLDISFRVHAEFQLQQPPRQPFWFTPAQFKGRLIVSRDMKLLKYFKMYVPNNRRLNVDMEWLKPDMEHSMEVDIGYMPEMSLVATSESRPASYDGYDLRTSHKPLTTAPEEVLDGLSWTKEVQVDVCEKAMEVVFYPFKTVRYYNYTQAYEAAAKEQKLVHSIVLWGALDDQSC